MCRLVICCLGCVLGLPFVTQGGEYILGLVDSTLIQLPTLVVCLSELVAIVYIYGLSHQSRRVFPFVVCISVYGILSGCL